MESSITLALCTRLSLSEPPLTNNLIPSMKWNLNNKCLSTWCKIASNSQSIITYSFFFYQEQNVQHIERKKEKPLQNKNINLDYVISMFQPTS